MLRKIICLTLFFSSPFTLITCSNENQSEATSVSIRFEFVWDDAAIEKVDSQVFYNNALGTQQSIERLRFLISDLSIENLDGTTTPLLAYHLVDLEKPDTQQVVIQQTLNTSTYASLTFRFGFSDEKNIDGQYQDLNAASWNVPKIAPLGNVGGYHYMQLEGKFLNDNQESIGYQYHTIRATNGSTTPPTFRDTSFIVNDGALNVKPNQVITIQMNVAQWFKSPHTWSLPQLHAVLMPNFNAQIMMNENGLNALRILFE